MVEAKTWSSGSGRFSGVGKDARYIVGKIHEALISSEPAEPIEMQALGS